MKTIIYTSPTCPWCNRAKEFLDKRDIKYSAVDVTKDEKEREQMIKKSGQMGVPVLDIKGTIIVGFDEEAIKKELGVI